MRGVVRKFLRPIGRVAAVAGMVIASIALSLLALEAGVRVLDGVPVFSTVNFVAVELDQVHKPGKVQVHYDPRVGWVQAPNLKLKEFTTGEYGVRMSGPEIVRLQEGAVLMVGDSFGAGSEVGDADSWPAQLERVIGRQVINAGAGGYGLDQIVLRAETLLPLLKPGILLVQTRLAFGILVNRMSIHGGAPKPYFTVQNGELVLHNEPVPRMASSSRDIGWVRSVLGHSYLVQYAMTRLNLLQWWAVPIPGKYEISNDEAVDVGCLLMRRLGELRDRHNIPVAVVFQYSGPEVMDAALAWEKDRDRIIGCAERARLEIVDILSALRSVYKTEGLSEYQKLWMMRDNNRAYGHMSPAGNRLIANLISRQLFSATTSEAKVR
jgi:hypothetical protein